MVTKKQKKNLKFTLIEFLKYNVAGNALFWSSYVLFILFYSVLGTNFAIAKLTSSLIGNVIHFALEKYWVFDKGNGQRKTRVELFRYTSFMIINFLIEYLIVYYLMEWFGVSPYLGPFLAGFFFWLWSYCGLKFWVFKNQKGVGPRGAVTKTA